MVFFALPEIAMRKICCPHKNKANFADPWKNQIIFEQNPKILVVYPNLDLCITWGKPEKSMGWYAVLDPICHGVLIKLYRCWLKPLTMWN